MDGFSVAEASEILGVPAPRIYRAAAKAGLTRPPAGTLRVPAEAVAAWLADWGWVPPDLRLGDLTRPQVFVLAALSRSPLGLRSARAVARRAGITPTTASAALARLGADGLVVERVERLVEGEVVDVPVWHLLWRSPRWRDVAVGVAAVVRPVPRVGPRRQRSVPSRFAHLFWNEDTAHLDVDRDGVMIADRVLRSADPEAIGWAGGAIAPASLRRVRGGRGVAPAVAALADALAAGR